MDPFTIYALGSLGVSGLSAIFGGGKDETKPYQNQLDDLTRQTLKTGNESREMGQSVLSPALDYIKAITGGDRNALLQATMPERRRVIDQYDTAKRAIAEFAPRGGGQVSALAGIEESKAGDLASLGPAARREAVGQGAQLGLGLRNSAAGAEGQAASNISSIIQNLLQKQGQDAQSAGALGESISTVLGMMMLNNMNKPGKVA